MTAEAVEPGYVICNYVTTLTGGDPDPVSWANKQVSNIPHEPYIKALEKAALAGMFMLSRLKFVVPIAAFHHYGETGVGVYLGYSGGSSKRYVAGETLYVQPGSWHYPCEKHSTEPVASMAAQLRGFMGHLWAAVDGSELGGPRTALARDEKDFMTSVTRDFPHDSVMDVIKIAQTAGLASVKLDSSGNSHTRLTKAGWVWYAANQRLAGDEVLANALPPNYYPIRRPRGQRWWRR